MVDDFEVAEGLLLRWRLRLRLRLGGVGGDYCLGGSGGRVGC